MRKRPRVLHLTPYFPPDYEFGGPVKLVAELVRGLSANYDVTVYSYNHYPDRSLEEIPGISIKRFKPFSRFLSRRFNFYYSPDLNKNIRQNINQFDLVHTHDYRSFHNVALTKLSPKTAPPLVMASYQSINPSTGQRHFKKIFDYLFARSLLSRVDRFIAVNDFEAEGINGFGIASKRIQVIPNAIEVPSTTVNPQSFRGKYGIPHDAQVALFFARLHFYKRPDLAVAAISLLAQNAPRLQLVLFGPDGGELAPLIRQVNELNLKSRVIFIAEPAGEMKAAALNESDLLLLPSPYNEFPLVLLEALAHGLPIVTCEQSLKVQVDNKAGLVVAPTARALADAVRVILTDKNLAKTFRRAGPGIFKQEFTIDRYVSRLDQLYRQLL